ncbi:hypothetical protein PanWU01x14_313750, partial [Parasponia andersonii]
PHDSRTQKSRKHDIWITRLCNIYKLFCGWITNNNRVMAHWSRQTNQTVTRIHDAILVKRAHLGIIFEIVEPNLGIAYWELWFDIKVSLVDSHPRYFKSSFGSIKYQSMS